MILSIDSKDSKAFDSVLDESGTLSLSPAHVIIEYVRKHLSGSMTSDTRVVNRSQAHIAIIMAKRYLVCGLN